MAIINRYPIPSDSFAPNRPLNDLLRAQLEHFQLVEKRLPRPLRPSLNAERAEPLPHDAPASNQYVAAMTTLIHERRAGQVAKEKRAKSSPVLVAKPTSPTVIDIAASAAAPASKSKKPTPDKPKSRKP